MRILYFSPREYWPPNTGARLRDYHLAKHLTEHAAVTYLGLRQAKDPILASAPPSENFERVVSLERAPGYSVGKILRGMIGPQPLTVLNYSSPRVESALAGLLQQTHFDAIQIEGVHLLSYVPLVRSLAPSAALIADWHNIESEIMWRYAETTQNLAKRLVAKRTARLIEQAEMRLLEKCDLHTVASDREREALQTRSQAALLYTIPNGVDIEFYKTVKNAEGGRDVLFVGSMDYHANIDAVQWLVKEIWPLIRQGQNDLRLVIVGRDPSPEVCALASQDVVITGTVADVRPYYANALALLTPLRIGSGTRLKILEGMASGVPVVSTRLGAEGLAVADQENILLADTPADLAAAILRLQRNPRLRADLIQAGRALVESSYDWGRLGSLLFDLHKQACEKKRRSSAVAVC